VAPRVAGAQAFRTRVVDARTGNPIAGAVALVRFQSGNRVGVLGEAVTDADGWLTFHGGSSRPVTEFAVYVYKFGYLLWSNVTIFRVPIGNGPPTGRWGPPSEARQDREIPDTILMAPFPSNGWRPTHAIYLGLAVDADGRHAERPLFWKAIQRELEEAQRQCGSACD
jgi:hypothetical protein